MENAITKLIQAEKSAEKERELLERKHQIIKTKGPSFWQQFLTFLEVDINKFNGVFEHPRSLHLLKSSNTQEVSVLRDKGYPQFQLHASLNERTVEYEYTLKIDRASEVVSKSCSLALDIDQDEDIVVLYDQRQLSYDELTEVLFEPILFPS